MKRAPRTRKEADGERLEAAAESNAPFYRSLRRKTETDVLARSTEVVANTESP